MEYLIKFPGAVPEMTSLLPNAKRMPDQWKMINLKINFEMTERSFIFVFSNELYEQRGTNTANDHRKVGAYL